MKQEEMIEFVRSKSPEYLKPLIPRATCQFYELGLEDYPNQAAQRIITMAKYLASALEDKGLSQGNALSLDLAPGRLLIARERLGNFLPRIIDLRKELFISEEAPFTWDKAVDWIEEEVAKDKRSFENEFGERIGALKAAQANMMSMRNKFNREFYVRCELAFNVDYLRYPNKLGKGSLARVSPNGHLSKLSTVTAEIANLTGFNQTSLVMFVLTGSEPYFISYQVIKSQSSRSIRSLSVKFNTSLPYEEFVKLYPLIKEFFKPKGSQLKERQLRIFEFVNNAGGIPQRNKVLFWKDLQLTWNSKFKKENFKTPDGLRIAYKRVEIYLRQNSQ
jgi:hypothetical protein